MCAENAHTCPRSLSVAEFVLVRSQAGYVLEKGRREVERADARARCESSGNRECAGDRRERRRDTGTARAECRKRDTDAAIGASSDEWMLRTSPLLSADAIIDATYDTLGHTLDLRQTVHGIESTRSSHRQIP